VVFFFLTAFTPATLNFPQLQSWGKIAYGWWKEIEQQRALERGDTLSDQAFELTWSYQQFLYDWVFSPTGQPPVDHGPDQSSLRSLLRDIILGPRDPYYQVNLPTTCSYERWTKDGLCTGQYDGFGYLFGNKVDLSLRWTAKSCGSDTLPSVQLQCFGTACRALGGPPVSCKSVSDCAPGLLCSPLTSLQFKQYNFDAIYLTQLGQIDSYTFLNETAGVPCTGSSYYLKDTVWFADALGQSVPGSPSFCTANWTIFNYGSYPHYQALDQFARRAWQGTQPVGDVIEIVLNFFKNWS